MLKTKTNICSTRGDDPLVYKQIPLEHQVGEREVSTSVSKTRLKAGYENEQF